MQSVDLIVGSGYGKIDGILRGIVELFELSFPNRLSGYYLTGSHSEGAALPSSDIDLIFLFRGQIGDDEEQRARRLVDCCALISPIELDVELLGYEIPYPLRAASLKLGSRLIYGEDTREQIPLPSPDAYTRHAMDLAFRLVARLHQRASPLVFPVGYPDPEGEFYGYDQPASSPGDGAGSNSTKDLVVTAGLAATAILAYQCGRYVSGKRDSIRQYQSARPDDWGAFLEELYTECRNRWSYEIPEAPDERRRLRTLCERALAFENHFLEVYRAYLLAQLLKATGEDRLCALQRLGHVLYPDAEVIAALRAIAGEGAERERQVAEETLRTLQGSGAKGV